MPLKDILEGKPLRTPLHPALVHLPIALFPLAGLIDVASWLVDRPDLQLVRMAFWCTLAGLVTGVIAGIVGMVDYTEIRNDHPAKKPATLHLILNLVALGVFAASAGLRFGELEASRTPGAALLVSLIALGVLAYSGYLGGHLVYGDGVGVGRHRRGRLPEQTVSVAGGAAGPVAVADDGSLREGETMRVDLDGVVLTLARVDGTVYAVQEFCPHRYGPLSEGALHGCEVECPWHRSRFDLRSGKVTAGPAKVDLRTFRVTTRAGKIWVEK